MTQDMDKYLDEKREAAMAAIGGDEPAEDAPAVEPVVAPAPEPQPEADPQPAEDVPATEPQETPDESEELPEATKAADDELEGELEDYLPPVGFNSDPEPEPEPELVTPVVDTAMQAENEQLKRDMAYMREQAELLEVSIEPPSLDFSPEELREIQDTSPAMAKAIMALRHQALKSEPGTAAAPAPAPAEPELTSAEKEHQITQRLIKGVPELDYWFNHQTDESGLVPEKIDRAQRFAIEADAQLRKDPKYANDQAARLKEAARLTVERLKTNLTKRATTASTPSMAAAPGSNSEGGIVAHITSLPPSQMYAEINKLPIDQQREVKRAIGM